MGKVETREAAREGDTVFFASELKHVPRAAVLEEAFDTLRTVNTALSDEVREMRDWSIDFDARMARTTRGLKETRASIQLLVQSEDMNGG